MSQSSFVIPPCPFTDDDIWRLADHYEFGIDTGSSFTTAHGTACKIAVIGGRQYVYRSSQKGLTIPSLISRISLPELIQSRASAEDADAKEVIRVKNGENITRLLPSAEGNDYVVGTWAEVEGRNMTAAKGNAARYYDTHAQVLVCTLLALLLPWREDERQSPPIIRLVTGLPWSLFTQPGVRTEVTVAFSRRFECYVNGEYRCFDVRHGAAIAEGYAPFALLSERDGREVSLDTGDRTTICLTAFNRTPVPDACVWEAVGVGNIHDEFRRLMRAKYRHPLTIAESQQYLELFSAGQPLPEITSSRKSLSSDDVRAMLEDLVHKNWLVIQNMLGQVLNQEGADVGSGIKRFTYYGGGSRIFHQALREFLPPSVELCVPDEHEAREWNAMYYHKLAQTLHEAKPDIWD